MYIKILLKPLRFAVLCSYDWIFSDWFVSVLHVFSDKLIMKIDLVLWLHKVTIIHTNIFRVFVLPRCVPLTILQVTPPLRKYFQINSWGAGQLARLCMEHTGATQKFHSSLFHSGITQLTGYISFPGGHHFTHWYQLHQILMCEMTIHQEKI